MTTLIALWWHRIALAVDRNNLKHQQRYYRGREVWIVFDPAVRHTQEMVRWREQRIRDLETRRVLRGAR